MVAIVCQGCNQVIDYQESEKIGTLYGVCSEGCHSHSQLVESNNE